jgi:hypothetical protein
MDRLRTISGERALLGGGLLLVTVGLERLLNAYLLGFAAGSHTPLVVGAVLASGGLATTTVVLLRRLNGITRTTRGARS